MYGKLPQSRNLLISLLTRIQMLIAIFFFHKSHGYIKKTTISTIRESKILKYKCDGIWPKIKTKTKASNMKGKT